MACKDMLEWIGDSYPKIDCGLDELGDDYCYLGPRGAKRRCYVHEAEYRGCCRRVPTLPPWAIPGETRVFLVHPEGCHPHQGSLFGYFLLERFEIVVDPTTYTDLTDPDLIPWSDDLFQVIRRTVRNTYDPSSLKGSDRKDLTTIVRKRFDEYSRHFAHEVARGKGKFLEPKHHPWPPPEETIEDIWEELLESILEKIIKNWLEELLLGEDGDLSPLNCMDMAGEPGRFCTGSSSGWFGDCPRSPHKRTKPGAAYAVDALAALIAKLFVAAVKSFFEKHGKQPSLAEKERIFRDVITEAHRQRKTKKRPRRDHTERLPGFLRKRMVQRGELILFPRPLPVIQRCPAASFLGYLRVDGDQLLSEVSHSLKDRNYLLKVPYCTGPHVEGPMTKGQLQAYFAGELRVNQKMVDCFFEELFIRAAEDIAQKGRFVLPGFGSFHLESDGQIGFYAYKSLRDKVSKSRRTSEASRPRRQPTH